VFSARIQKKLQARPPSAFASISAPPEAPSVLSACVQSVQQSVQEVHGHLMKSLSAVDKELLPASARQLAYSLSRIYCGALLIEHAVWSQTVVDAEIARRWCVEQKLVQMPVTTSSYRNLTKMIALDVDVNTGRARGAGDVGINGKPRSKY